jgi:OmpA-like transmembrane domain
MKKLLHSLIVSSVFSAATVCAQNADLKFYGGAELGGAMLSNETGKLASTTMQANGGAAIATQDSIAHVFRIFGGYKVNENIDLEVGYFEAPKRHTRITGRSAASADFISSGYEQSKGIDYSAVIRPNVSSGYNNLFVRIGITEYDSSTTMFASGSTYLANSHLSGTGRFLGAGYDAPLDSNMSLRLSVNRLSRISGNVDGSATVYSIGVINRF